MFQFFWRKAPRQCPAGLFFEKLVGGLEANNHEKENFKNSQREGAFWQKKVNESILFLLII